MLFLVLCRGPTTREGESVLFGPFLPFVMPAFGTFRKLGVPYFGVLIVRILLFRVLYQGPLSSEALICRTVETRSADVKGLEFQVRTPRGALVAVAGEGTSTVPRPNTTPYIYIYIYIYPDMFCVYVSGVLQGIPETLNPKP